MPYYKVFAMDRRLLRLATSQEPDLLIAEAATSCRVSAERCRDVEIGDEDLCGWP